jgi:histone H1/5
MSKAAPKKSNPTLQPKIDAATKHVREADHRKNLLEARARGAKAGLKAAKKAFKLAKKAARKAAKVAKRAHKELRVLVKQANQKPGKAKPATKVKAKAPAKRVRKRPARKAVMTQVSAPQTETASTSELESITSPAPLVAGV